LEFYEDFDILLLFLYDLLLLCDLLLLYDLLLFSPLLLFELIFFIEYTLLDLINLLTGSVGYDILLFFLI